MRRVNMSAIAVAVIASMRDVFSEENYVTIPKIRTNNRVSGNKVSATKGKRHASQRSRSNRRK